MATNYIRDGKQVKLAFATGSAGDPVKKQNLNGVLLTDSDGTNAVVALEGVFDLPVTTAGTVAVGDILYWNGTDVDDVAMGGTPFGYALEAIGGASTATINVLLTQQI